MEKKSSEFEEEPNLEADSEIDEDELVLEDKDLGEW